MVREYFKSLEKLVLSNVSRFKVEFSGSISMAFQGYEKVLEKYVDAVLLDSTKDYEVLARLGYREVTKKNLPESVLNRLSIQDSGDMEKIVNETAQLITGTTRDQIARVITENRQDYDKMVSKLKSKFKEMGEASHSRAVTIARTETSRIANLGAFSGAAEGGATHKQWIWSGIDREFHAEMDGQVVLLEESFVSGLGNNLMYPVDPTAPPEETINCGCDFIPLTLSHEEAAEV